MSLEMTNFEEQMMRADRLLTLMFRLQAGKKMTAQALADALEVSRRTILRDVEALSTAGVPIYADKGHGGGIALDENYRVSLTGLKESEVRALFLSGNAKLMTDIGLGEASENILPKLFAVLPSLHQQAVEHLRQCVHIDPTWWNEGDTPPFLPDLLNAVYESRCLQIVYKNHEGNIAERVIEPYSLVAKSGIWYLIAMRTDEFRTYRVSRLHQVNVLKTRFQRQQDFDLETYWRDHVQEFFDSLLQYRFTLRVHERQLNLLRWYSTGRYDILEPADADGWFTARFEAESIIPAKMMVFGLGADAVVLEPQELREIVLAQSRALISANDG
jgi:predicted DNA-binding transcriptional regulator YafY